MNMVVATSYGTSGQVLTSNGSSSTPTFKALPTTPYYKQTASVGATAYRSGNVITINGAYNLQTTDAWETVMTLNDSFPAPTEEISFCAIGSGNSSINSVLAEGRINTDKTVQLLSNNNSGLVRFNATYIVNG
jgi:hypothetical protein